MAHRRRMEGQPGDGPHAGRRAVRRFPASAPWGPVNGRLLLLAIPSTPASGRWDLNGAPGVAVIDGSTRRTAESPIFLIAIAPS